MITTPHVFDDETVDSCRQVDLSEQHRILHTLTGVFQLRLLNNPIINRELLARMRGAGSFAIWGVFLVVSTAIFLLLWQRMLETTGGGNAASPEALRINFLRVFTGQSFAVMLMVPLLTATVIRIEKDRSTWDLLYTTPLNLINILFGKLLSSTAFLIFFAVSVIPFYALAGVRGSITLFEVCVFFILFMEMILFGSLLGLLASIRCYTIPTAVLYAYGLITIYLIAALYAGGGRFLPAFLSPFAVATMLYSVPDGATAMVPALFSPGMIYFAIHFIIYAFCIAALFIYCLASLLQLVEREYELSALGEIWREIRLLTQQYRPTLRFYFNDHFPDGKNAVYVREIRALFGRYGSGFAAWVSVLFILGIYAVFKNTSFSMQPGNVSRVLDWRVLFTDYPLLLTPLLIAPYACNALRKEFHQDTWDLLRSTSVTPARIVWGKFIAAFQSFQIQFWAFMAFAVGYAVYFITTVDYKSVALGLYTSLLSALFLCPLGLYLSIRMRKSLYSLLVVVILYYGLFIYLPYAVVHNTASLLSTHLYAFIYSPAFVMKWCVLDMQMPVIKQVTLLLLNTALMLSLAWLFWKMTLHRVKNAELPTSNA